jgi:hypothetical protein
MLLRWRNILAFILAAGILAWVGALVVGGEWVGHRLRRWRGLRPSLVRVGQVRVLREWGVLGHGVVSGFGRGRLGFFVIPDFLARRFSGLAWVSGLAWA